MILIIKLLNYYILVLLGTIGDCIEATFWETVFYLDLRSYSDPSMGLLPRGNTKISEFIEV